MLIFGSLFAGIGGFDKGLHDAGMACAWQVEIDDKARSVLARHWPDVPRYADIRDCGTHNLSAVDIICGGFPCQDLSVAGKRNGLKGARSGLFYEMTRIADELRPAFVLWENVPGLLSSRSGRDFAAVLMELERVGYCGCWTTLDAQWFGVAQRRQRVFGLFARRDIGAAVCAEILSLAARLPWNTQTGRKARARVAAAATASAGHHGRSSPRGDGGDNLISAFAWHRTNADVSDGVSPSLTVSDSHAPAVYSPAIAQSNRGRDGDVFETVRAGSHGALPMVFGGNDTRGERAVSSALTSHGSGRYDFESESFVVAATLSSGGNNGGFRTEPGEHIVPILEVGKRTNGDGYRDGDGIGDEGDPMYTLQSGAQHGVFAFTSRGRENGAEIETQEDLAFAERTPGGGAQRSLMGGSFGVRRLTPVECERLQGFDDGWTDGQADSVRYRQLGNAVCVSVARWIGRRIVEVL